MFENGLWKTVIDGVESGWNEDPMAVEADRVWHYGKKCKEHYYNYLEALRIHYRKYPHLHHPSANAREPIDKSRLKPISV